MLPEEQSLGQKFRVDAELRCDLSRAGRSDDLRDSIDYAEAYRQIQEAVTVRVTVRLETTPETLSLTTLFHQPLTLSLLSIIATQGPPHQLVEKLAQDIADRMLRLGGEEGSQTTPVVQAVRVRVMKPHVAVDGPVKYLGVEIHRIRGSSSGG